MIRLDIQHNIVLTGETSQPDNVFGAIADFSLRFSLQRAQRTFRSDTQGEIHSSIQMHASWAQTGGINL